MAVENSLITRKGRGKFATTKVHPEGLELIERMAALGNDPATIGTALGGMNRSTLTQLRSRDPEVQAAFDRGHAVLSDTITHTLLEQFKKGNTVAGIFLAKARLGWREGELPDGKKPPAVNVNISIPPAMSEKELMKVIDGKVVE